MRVTMKKFKNLLPIFISALLFISCDDRATYTWNKDSLDNIINENDDKMILVDFETDWCVWCDRLDKDTYSDNRIIEFAEQLSRVFTF